LALPPLTEAFEWLTSKLQLTVQERTAARAREFFGLHVDVPWSGWGGQYARSTVSSRGVVWDYQAGKFTIRFPPEAKMNEVGMSWDELRWESNRGVRRQSVPWCCTPCLAPSSSIMGLNRVE